MEEQESQENASQHSPENEHDLLQCISLAEKLTDCVTNLKVVKNAQQEHNEVQNMMSNLVERLRQMENTHNCHENNCHENKPKQDPIMERLSNME
jgi:hypothetical protein